jgi:hypothetical protein
MWEANLSFIVAPRQQPPTGVSLPSGESLSHPGLTTKATASTAAAAAAAAAAGERGDNTSGETDTESDAGSYTATAGTADSCSGSVDGASGGDYDEDADAAGSDTTTDADIWRLVFGSDPPGDDDEESGAGPWLDLAAISDK